jgi:demethylmenaquinone methyltransferase/2-methoxy-6-polyprenyl-1,4-benzoquinol methylase
MNTSTPPSDTVDFGYEQVERSHKVERVRAVFDSVANRYDLMNDLMSLGIHRFWKWFLLSQTGLKPGQTALDVAGGTADISIGMSKQVGPQGRVILSDINAAMLEAGRKRLIDAGIVHNTEIICANAEKLPFANQSFHCVTIAFGLRNVTNKVEALKEMTRVLKPGGQLLILEFSKPVLPLLKPIYDAYSFNILPRLGKWIANDADSYRYLAESIRMFPDQTTLASMMGEAGLSNVKHHNLSGGIVALHRGYRF